MLIEFMDSEEYEATSLGGDYLTFQAKEDSLPQIGRRAASTHRIELAEFKCLSSLVV
jgi:hypothetical protein